MGWLAVILLWAFIIIKLAWSNKPTPKEIVFNKSDDVTVEDMILYDMENSDDVYDIGKIDLNE